MTKKDMVDRIVRPIVVASLVTTYGMRTSPTDKQMELVERIVEGLYFQFAPHLGVKELKEILGDQNELANAV